MDSSRFIIVGANGQLGKALQARFPDAHPVDRGELDITDTAALDAFDWSKFDVVLNAAAYTNVDGAETAEGREAAWKINGQAPANLAKIANQHDVTLVHVSSDYVFDGTKTPHTEDEPVSPLSYYGSAKAAGDIAVGVAPKHYIMRTTWLIGDGPNFVRTMIGLAAKNISPTVVSDQIGRLAFTDTLVDCIEQVLKTKAEFGIYNATNDGEPASWANVTRAIFKDLGRDDLIVIDTTTTEYFASKTGVAPRPLQSAMDLTKIKATGLNLRDWRDELSTYIADEQKKEKE
jgi:dTDP-4-dehydrorhamnose 3,5-epimerase